MSINRMAAKIGIEVFLEKFNVHPILGSFLGTKIRGSFAEK